MDENNSKIKHALLHLPGRYLIPLKTLAAMMNQEGFGRMHRVLKLLFGDNWKEQLGKYWFYFVIFIKICNSECRFITSCCSPGCETIANELYIHSESVRTQNTSKDVQFSPQALLYLVNLFNANLGIL